MERNDEKNMQSRDDINKKGDILFFNYSAPPSPTS